MSKKISKAYADLPWGQLHFRTVAGTAGQAPMVLLHQTPLSSRNYEKLLPLITKKCSAYALDTPGYGESGEVTESWEVRVGPYQKSARVISSHRREQLLSASRGGDHLLSTSGSDWNISFESPDGRIHLYLQLQN